MGARLYFKNTGKTTYCEVNGSHEPVPSTKKQVHEKMSKLGTVLSFDAYGAEKEDAFTYLMESIHYSGKKSFNTYRIRPYSMKYNNYRRIPAIVWFHPIQ